MLSAKVDRRGVQTYMEPMTEDAQNSQVADSSEPQLHARIEQLEFDARIAEFHRAEMKREWTITLVIVQFGIALTGAIYAAVYFGWIPPKLVATDGPLVGYAALLVVFATVGHAMSSIRDIIRMRRDERSAFLPNPAE